MSLACLHLQSRTRKERQNKYMALSHARTYLDGVRPSVPGDDGASTCGAVTPHDPTQHSLAGMPECSLLLPLCFPLQDDQARTVCHLSCTQEWTYHYDKLWRPSELRPVQTPLPVLPPCLDASLPALEKIVKRLRPFSLSHSLQGPVVE